MTKLQKLYLEMYRIRRAEEAIAKEYPKQEMRGPVHLSLGQEATAVGICNLLNKDDLMVGTHRAHAWYLAKGGSLRALLSELYGKVDGCGRGQAGSMHLVDHNVGFIGATSIVAGTIPVGVGLAFAKKLKKEAGLSVITFGDAAIEEGVFHEAANFAALHNLPVIFVCENNLYSCYTHIKNRQPEKRSMWNMASAHGLEYIGADGNDALHVRDWCADHIDLVRRGGRPLFIELKTYRRVEHCGPYEDDHLNYRDEKERAFWFSKDPLEKTKAQLISAGEWGGFGEDLLLIEEEIEKEMRVAQKAHFPQTWETGRYLYADN